jgi:hypothetical protein
VYIIIIIIIIIIYSCGYGRMIFSDDSAGICKEVIIGLYEIAWSPAQVSTTLKRTGVKTRDLKRHPGLRMCETVTCSLTDHKAVILNEMVTGTFLFIAAVSPLALLPPSVDSTLTICRTWCGFKVNISSE